MQDLAGCTLVDLDAAVGSLAATEAGGFVFLGDNLRCWVQVVDGILDTLGGSLAALLVSGCCEGNDVSCLNRAHSLDWGFVYKLLPIPPLSQRRILNTTS